MRICGYGYADTVTSNHLAQVLCEYICRFSFFGEWQSRDAATLRSHAAQSPCEVTLRRHAAQSRCAITLRSHVAQSRWAVTLRSHAAQSRCAVTLRGHAAQSHCTVTLRSHAATGAPLFGLMECARHGSENLNFWGREKPVKSL